MALPQMAVVLEQLLVTSAMIGDIAADPTSSHPASSHVADYQRRHQALIVELLAVTEGTADPGVQKACEEVAAAASTIAERSQGSAMRSDAVATYFEAGALLLHNASPVI